LVYQRRDAREWICRRPKKDQRRRANRQVFLLAMPLDGPPLLVTTLSFAGPVAGSSVPVESYRGTITISEEGGKDAKEIVSTK